MSSTREVREEEPREEERLLVAALPTLPLLLQNPDWLEKRWSEESPGHHGKGGYHRHVWQLSRAFCKCHRFVSPSCLILVSPAFLSPVPQGLAQSLLIAIDAYACIRYTTYVYV